MCFSNWLTIHKVIIFFSHGSATLSLRNSEKYCINFVILLFPAVKESKIICKIDEQLMKLLQKV